MNIKIDRALCIGAGSCIAHAVKTFQLDDENKAKVLNTRDSEAEIIFAAETCPTKAIILTNEKGKQIYP